MGATYDNGTTGTDTNFRTKASAWIRFNLNYTTADGEAKVLELPRKVKLSVGNEDDDKLLAWLLRHPEAKESVSFEVDVVEQREKPALDD